MFGHFSPFSGKSNIGKAKPITTSHGNIKDGDQCSKDSSEAKLPLCLILTLRFSGFKRQQECRIAPHLELKDFSCVIFRQTFKLFQFTETVEGIKIITETSKPNGC